MRLLNLFKNYTVQYMFWPRKTELPETFVNYTQLSIIRDNGGDGNHD
jgi:hypothetical protein